jgi:hypothetical protein
VLGDLDQKTLVYIGITRAGDQLQLLRAIRLLAVGGGGGG